MTDQQYNELQNVYTKKALASMYCLQFDTFKTLQISLNLQQS